MNKQEPGQTQENLGKLLEQHWDHCRHLENERTGLFIGYVGSMVAILGSLYLAKVGVFTIVNPLGRWIMIIPLIFTLLCFSLTWRWGQSFEKHRRVVNAIIWNLEVGKIINKDGKEVPKQDMDMDIPTNWFFHLFRTRWLFNSFYLFISFIFILLIVIFP